MMKRIFTAMTIGASLLCGYADTAADITLQNGRVLKAAQVVSSGDDFVNIQYADGVVKVMYSELAEAQQKAFHMTPQEVTERLERRKLEAEARRQRAEVAKQEAREAARKLRASLTEAERSPRYLQGADVHRIFLTAGDLPAIEAEVLALQWNVLEAERTGLIDDARIFRSRIADLQGQLDKIRAERKQTEQYWQELETNYRKLQESSQQQIAALNNQVAQLKTQLQAEAKKPRTEMIISQPVIAPWNYPPPPIIVNRPRPIILPPRPRPIQPARPVAPRPVPQVRPPAPRPPQAAPRR